MLCSQSHSHRADATWWCWSRRSCTGCSQWCTGRRVFRDMTNEVHRTPQVWCSVDDGERSRCHQCEIDEIVEANWNQMCGRSWKNGRHLLMKRECRSMWWSSVVWSGLCLLRKDLHRWRRGWNCRFSVCKKERIAWLSCSCRKKTSAMASSKLFSSSMFSAEQLK